MLINMMTWFAFSDLFRKSFVWLCVGFTCVTFVTGALAFWAPKFMFYASQVQGMKDSQNKYGLIYFIMYLSNKISLTSDSVWDALFEERSKADS